ncbi:SDR family NAD(P)-dependent oxidoreductase [Caulobacter segnis]|uniref:Short-chain dehydrogenase/reductase SDR n=2 Tax=Caulobacter segnis TaxID=88688 RepID=D5VK45_CAUST|nr:SDR family oxidoreductase [Caulobacter segnis]ADG10868.1 short-chain dehydrogenase/reductase SDR [Caulobacter segnis ATCC 21756]AVQ02569.1 SDR family NAD(P)-dependent oxidoreductase [Caulobacter segnis]
MSGALLIVGAGPGIGEAAAERFGREGWTIVLAARGPRTLDAMVARLIGQGVNAHGLVIDATDPEAVRAGLRTADKLSGGLTAVLYNAAKVRQQDLFSMTDAEIDSDLAVNVTGGLHTIRAAAGLFEDRGGTILVTGGGLAVAPHSDWASLGLGKAALRNLVQGLAPALAERNIRIGMATVATLVAPASAEASGVADTLWSLATDPDADWEQTFPAA